MSQIDLLEKISEIIKVDYRDRLKRIQTSIKNNKSISRIDEIYLQKVLVLDSLPNDFVKKNEMLRNTGPDNTTTPKIINKIIGEQTVNSLKKNLHQDKLKSDVENLKEKNNVSSNKERKFDKQNNTFKNEKGDIRANLQSELKNITTQLSSEKTIVKEQEDKINELTLHYQNTISELNNGILVAKKEYEMVIRKRELLTHEMQSLKHNYDIATKLKTETEKDVTSEKNIQLIKANKIKESIKEISQQNEVLSEQINNQTQIKKQNLEQIRRVRKEIIKQDNLIKIINNLLTHIQEQRRLSNDLIKANETYNMKFNEKILSINNMKGLINENLEHITKSTEK